DSTPFDKVDEQNNEDSTLEQSTELLVHEEVKTSTPNSEYENCSNDFQQTAIEEDNSLDLLKINFIQTTISPWFKSYDRYNIEETTEDLVLKAVKNRAKFNKVPVKIVRETDEKARFK
ncbi:30953_t:CDS:2, partial [Gigaspora margarita]